MGSNVAGCCEGLSTSSFLAWNFGLTSTLSGSVDSSGPARLPPTDKNGGKSN